MRSPKVQVKAELLRWAIERADIDPATLRSEFRWIEDDTPTPTLKQLRKFAQKVHAPFGYLFAAKPPDERLPIADFRTTTAARRARPSVDLLDTLYACERRQDWYRSEVLAQGMRALPFVRSARLDDAPKEVAAKMAAALDFEFSKDEAPFKTLRAAAERLGVLVMASSFVGTNPQRKLDVGEFRGFAMADPFAPLVFVNTADAAPARLFTLAHELAHLWLGETGLSSISGQAVEQERTERWCNRVAAELLVPEAALRPALPGGPYDTDLVRELARRFFVSPMVMLRRLYELQELTEQRMWELYRVEQQRWENTPRTGGGGKDAYYFGLRSRLGSNFAEAVVIAAWESRESFTTAMRLTDTRSMKSFEALSRVLGIQTENTSASGSLAQHRTKSSWQRLRSIPMLTSSAGPSDRVVCFSIRSGTTTPNILRKSPRATRSSARTLSRSSGARMTPGRSSIGRIDSIRVSQDRSCMFSRTAVTSRWKTSRRRLRSCSSISSGAWNRARPLT